MKTLYTTYNNFAKRAAIILTLLTLGVTSVWAQEEELVYTLDGTVKEGSNGYDTESTITQSDISWSITGNTQMAPWRIGGKSLSKEERAIYSTKAINDDISKIVITHGGASSITVNSMTVIVSTIKNGGGTVISTLTPTFSANGDVTITRPDGKDWSEAYYKIVYNVTVSSTSNKFIEFTSAKFYKTTAPSTFTVTCQSNNSSYGTVSQPSVVTNVANNTAISANGNTLTVGTTTVTATPAEKDANYSYSFNNWSGIPSGNKVTANCTITANFTRTPRDLTNYRTSCSDEPIQLATPNVTLTYDCTTATISWDKDANASAYWYQIKKSSDTDAGISSVNTTYTRDDLEQGTSYAWSVKAIGDGTTYLTSEIATGTFTTGYTITYETNGGSAVENACGTNLPSPLPTTTQDGYNFLGWYTDIDLTNQATEGAAITKNTTLYAKWEKVKTATSLTWSADSYTATIASESNVFPTLTINPEAIKGSVTYSSSHPEYATIDANGNIILKLAGETTITATYAGDEDYAAAEDTYTLIVEESDNCRWEEVTINDIEYGDEVVIAVGGTDVNGEAILYMLQDPQEAKNPIVKQMSMTDFLDVTNLNNILIWNIRKRDNNQDNFTIYKKGSTSDRLAFISNYGVRVGGNNADSIFTLTSERYIKSISSNEYLRMSASSDWRHYSTNTAQSFVFYKKVCLPEGQYRVTWDANGGQWSDGSTIKEEVYAEGATINKPDIPKRDGYEFTEWAPNLTTMPDENTTFKAQWAELHTITWMVGNNSVLTEKVANETGVTQTPADPVNGAIGNCADAFVGWTETSLGSAEGQSAPADLCTAAQMKSKHGSVTSDKTFYAVFATAEETEGGTMDVTTSVNIGTYATANSWEDKKTYSSITIDENITAKASKSGGSTSNTGYYSSSNAHWRFYQTEESSLAITAAENCTIQTVKVTYTAENSGVLTYNGNNQSSNTLITVNATSAIFGVGNTGTKTNGQVRISEIEVAYSKPGGTITTYSNYVTNCCATPVPTNGSYTSPSGTSVTLTWDGESTQYHITGNGLDDYTDDESYTITDLEECEEYVYYVSAYPKGGCESEAIAITAQPFSGAKTVTFNYNGNGQANTTSSTSCGNTSITLPTPVWTGYRFIGWFNAASGGTKVGEAGASYKPTDDITLHAHWEKEYTVTYDANGGSTSCTRGNYIAGETVTICTTNPTKTGYTFAGWTYSPEVTITDGKFTMPASDVTITAQWQVNSYTVTWNPNGGNWAGSTENIVHTYDYGATIVQPAAPQRDGYRFTGWSPAVSSTMPAGDKTYTAQWKQNYTITFYDGDDVTPWTQTKDAESINLTEYVGTLACDDYQFAGWSTDATKYDDEPANITTWVTGTYTPTANIHLYAVYVKGDLATDFTLNCDGGVYEIWEKGHNQHMAGRQNGGGDKFYTTEYWDANNSESNGAPFTITKVADQTYTLQNADGQYITRDSYYEDELEIEETWENADRYKWTISNGTNGTWRFTNKAATSYALVYYDNRYFELRSASSVTAGNTTTYDLELTPAQTNVYQSNPNCGPYYIIFNTHGGEFIQGEYAYGDEQTGLTETTYSKFPAAELEGYTFAGWKDGSPIDDEITSDNASDAPYLKQAGEDLVVSSNKTYHAVYYYYDEEEDIDFSKEFTTSIYAEVNGMKYFLAGTPSSGTMSSTTDCGYVSEVTITPGTGANAGKYKITVNGVAMAPKANETDLLNGTYWWTITERSVGSGEYKISGQDKKNIVLFNSSWGHYSYNQGSEYGNNYYYPRFGKCLQHHWTSNPTLKPSLNLSGEVYVTATNARGIMATSTLKVSAQQLNANEKVNITSNSNDVYFSADCTVNFVKANKPTNTLTITASPSGVIEQDIYVHYKPSAEGNGTPASVVVSANLATPNPSVTDDQTIHVRNMPAKFVIATKVGATWYALPADMSSATNPLGVVIEVDETTMTTIAPNTTTYTLWPVKTTATENDRYTNVTGAAYGDRLRFSAVNNSYKGLWANNSKTDLTINNNMVIDQASDGQTGSDLANNSYYEWKVTTTVVDGHWQYTLQTDQTQNQNYLRYWVGATGAPKWGTYAAGNNQLYFLPVTETEPFDYKVVEWYPTKMLIQTDATIANPTAEIGDAQINNVTCTNKGSKLYEIAGLPLENNPTKVLTIKFSDGGNNYTNATTIPVIISRSTTNMSGEPFVTLTKDVYNYADLVVHDGATLTINGETHAENTFFNVTIYPTSKISVPEGKKLTVHSLTFFGGIDEIYNGSTYTLNKYGVPELSLKGTLKKSISTIDYLMRVDSKQMYSLTVPYDVQLADIKYWDGTNIVLGDELWVSAYDGASRAQNQGNGKNWIYETDFESKLGAATLKAGVGYTISAELQAGVGSEYSILRMPMNSNIANDATEVEKSVPVTAHGIDANVTDNHKGWNLVGNPYMTSIKGADDDDLVLGYLKETGTGPWKWVDDGIRYVTIPSDDGTYYWQQKFTDAVLPPFKNFFVQIGTTGELQFGLGTRQSMPARSTQAAIEKEVEFEILMSNDARQDNTGLLISKEYSPAYEINADLEKMIGSMSVYTIYGGYKLAYNALSPINASEWIPMGYIAPTAGEYTLRLDDIDKIAEQVEHVYIIDYNANNIVDLMDEEYKFTTDKEQNDNRFAINVVLVQDKDNTTTGLDIIQGNNAAPIKFIHQDKMYIYNEGIIYDATGKQVTNINK